MLPVHKDRKDAIAGGRAGYLNEMPQCCRSIRTGKTGEGGNPHPA